MLGISRFSIVCDMYITFGGLLCGLRKVIPPYALENLEPGIIDFIIMCRHSNEVIYPPKNWTIKPVAADYWLSGSKCIGK